MPTTQKKSFGLFEEFPHFFANQKNRHLNLETITWIWKPQGKMGPNEARALMCRAVQGTHLAHQFDKFSQFQRSIVVGIRIFLREKNLHPWKLRWNSKNGGLEMFLLFQGGIFRFHLSFWGCSTFFRGFLGLGGFWGLVFFFVGPEKMSAGFCYEVSNHFVWI